MPSLKDPVDLQRCFGCFFICFYIFAKNTSKSLGAGTLDHKESRNKTEAASGSENAAKVQIVVSINTCSVRDGVYFHTSNNALVSSTLQGLLDIFYNRLLPTNQTVR